MAISSVAIIGSGNLATHLAQSIFQNGINIAWIYSRNQQHASELATKVDAKVISTLQNFPPCDLIIISISDSAIPEISKLIHSQNLVVHTSGSTSINILESHTNYGVFYPFQTFSKSVEVNFSNVPVFIEANSADNTYLLMELAGKISTNVKPLNSEQRLKLHLAAVFANNFSNHMFAIANEILREANLPFDILNHLIQETTAKAISSGNPTEVQTGPAARNNLNILEQHTQILSHRPLWQKIYTFVSNSIMDKEIEKKHGAF